MADTQDRRDKRSRKSRLEDFSLGADGEYHYIGQTHAFVSEGKTRRRALGELGVWASGSCLAGVGTGLLSIPGGTGCVYVILPSALAVVAAILLAGLTARLAAAGDPLRHYVYQGTVEKFKPAGWFAVLSAAAAVIGEGVYLLLHGLEGESAAAVGCFFLLQAAQGALAGVWMVRAAALRWES